jgi:hypothetical protein
MSMEFARVEDDAIMETRSLEHHGIPEHKRHLWRLIEGTKPAHDPVFETIAGPVLVIEPTRACGRGP